MPFRPLKRKAGSAKRDGEFECVSHTSRRGPFLTDKPLSVRRLGPKHLFLYAGISLGYYLCAGVLLSLPHIGLGLLFFSNAFLSAIGLLVYFFSLGIDEEDRGQFRIGTLLCWMTLVAVGLGVLRWFVNSTAAELGATQSLVDWIVILCFYTLLTVANLQFAAFFCIWLSWKAAWLVRQPWMRRLLRRQ